MSKFITITLNTAIDCLINEADFTGVDDLSKAALIAAGKGINVARALASSNNKVIVTGFTGSEDAHLFKDLQSGLILNELLKVNGSTRRNITVTHCSDGLENHLRTEGYALSGKDIKALVRKLDSLVESGDFVIFSGSLPKGAPANIYKKLIKRYRKRNTFIALDTSSDALKEAVKASPNVIKPNREEMSELISTMKGFSGESPLSFISKRCHIDYILETLGSEGAALYDGINLREELFIISGDNLPRPEEIVSSVGCGDCALAGFLCGLKENLPINECLKLSMDFARRNLFTDVPGDINADCKA